MVLEWTLSKRLGLTYSKIDLSLLQPQSASQEKHGRLSITLLDQGTGGFVRDLRCMCIIDLSLLHLKRASETQNHHLMDTRAPREV